MRITYEAKVESLVVDFGMQLAIEAEDDREFMDGLAMASVLLLDQLIGEDELEEEQKPKRDYDDEDDDFDPFDDDDEEIWPEAWEEELEEDDEDEDEWGDEDDLLDFRIDRFLDDGGPANDHGP